MFEPFLGGGLVTALSISMIDGIGLTPALFGALVITALLVVLGVRRQRAITR